MLLLRDNFFQDLLFYEKDEIPDRIYRSLKKYNNDPETSPEALLLVSHAASSLSSWIRSVYQYCDIIRSLDPKKTELAKLAKALNKVAGFCQVLSLDNLIF